MSDTTSSSEQAAPSRAVAVGRGALLITAGKGWFLVTATVVNLGLASVLGSVDYGDYGVTIRWVSLLNMMVVQGMLQGLSRAVSKEPMSAGVFRRQAMGPVALVGGVAAVVLLLVASPLAGLLEDARLTPLLMMSSLITLAYAFYAAWLGLLNGLQRFSTQAWTDMGLSTAKMVFILGAALLGLGAVGSVAGFGLAAVMVAAVTWWNTRGLPSEPPQQHITVKSLLSFSGVVMGYQALLNLLMFVDLGFVKRASGTGTLPAEAAGWYTGAINVAQMPYLACTAITFVVFPLLGSVGSQAPEEARKIVEKGLRYALLVACAPAVALVASAPGVLTAVFPPAYVGATQVLRILALAYVMTALASVTCTMLNALGRPQASLGSVAVGALVSLGLCALLLPWLGLEGAALGSLGGMATTLALSLWALHSTGRGAFPWKSLARQALVALVMGAAGMLVNWPTGTLLARAVGVAGAVGAGILTLVLLFAVGELGRDDVAMVARLASRKRGA